jgi:hypothetical protein
VLFPVFLLANTAATPTSVGILYLYGGVHFACNYAHVYETSVFNVVVSGRHYKINIIDLRSQLSCWCCCYRINTGGFPDLHFAWGKRRTKYRYKYKYTYEYGIIFYTYTYVRRIQVQDTVMAGLGLQYLTKTVRKPQRRGVNFDPPIIWFFVLVLLYEKCSRCFRNAPGRLSHKKQKSLTLKNVFWGQAGCGCGDVTSLWYAKT